MAERDRADIREASSTKPAARSAVLSIVVVSWNTRALLTSCLAAIEAHPPSVSHETWVVDNASTDGSAEMVRERFPWALLVESPQNVGFAAANNLAFARLTGQQVLLLNSDAELRPGALDAMLKALKENLEIGAVGARLEHPDGSLQRSCHHAPTVLREWVHLMHLDRWLPGLYYRPAYFEGPGPRDVEVVQGACMLLRRKALEHAGGLDEGYFMYSEEVELCERLRAAGWRITWLPEARVLHHGGGSTARVADEMFLQLFVSKLRFFRRNRGTATARLYKCSLVPVCLSRIVLLPLAAVTDRDRSRRVTCTAARYARLLRRIWRL